MTSVDCLLVGSFHMANPGADVVSLQVADVLASNRQQEIKVVVGSLQRFEPIAVLRDGTFGDALRFVNSPDERAAMLAPYLEALLPIAGSGNWSGPEMVANWYRRNFKIAATIHAVAEDGDRLAVIFGAGHIPVVEHALGFSRRIRLADPLDFLPSR